MKTKELSAILILVGMSSACGPVIDPNTVDRQKNEQEVLAMTSLEGTYNGTLTSKRTGATVGFASLHLDGDSTIYYAPSDPRSQSKPVLRATMDVQLEGKKLSLTFNEYDFNRVTKALIVGYNPLSSVSQMGSDNGAAGFKLAGNYNEGIITGDIHAGAYLHDGYSITLRLNGPQTESSRMMARTHTTTAAILERFEKRYRKVSESNRVSPTLVLTASTTSHEDEFTRLLSPVQTIDAFYRYGFDLSTPFFGSKWDSRAGTLIGVFKSNAGPNSADHTLNCISSGESSGHLRFPDQLDCTVVTTNRGITGKFKLVAYVPEMVIETPESVDTNCATVLFQTAESLHFVKKVLGEFPIYWDDSMSHKGATHSGHWPSIFLRHDADYFDLAHEYQHAQDRDLYQEIEASLRTLTAFKNDDSLTMEYMAFISDWRATAAEMIALNNHSQKERMAELKESFYKSSPDIAATVKEFSGAEMQTFLGIFKKYDLAGNKFLPFKMSKN